MQNTFLDGITLHRLFTSGYRNLKQNMNTVNDLNVFPVPDGDTGTNMVHTFGGGLNAAREDVSHLGDYMKELSRGVLLSARGNSGVIFSQFFHGLYRGFAQLEQADFADVAKAFVYATEDAYAAVMRPTEGTILTIIREAAEFLKDNAHRYDNLTDGFEALLNNMKNTLAHTPELLPVLQEAGVVDSGGAGLVCFVEGMCACLRGEDIEDIAVPVQVAAAVDTGAGSFGPDSELTFGYCTEFILQLTHAKTDIAAFDMDRFLEPLYAMGDSIAAVRNDSIVKLHIHSFTPEKVLEYGRSFGEFITLKIENMSVQHSQVEASEPKREKVRYAIVAVASGAGIVDYFSHIGANAVIDGGQTNNPSVDAFLDAFDQFDAEQIVVLPNNSNIVLTANQAAQMYTKTPVHVIPTKSIVEGYSALSMMDLSSDTVEELVEGMSAGLSRVTTGYVTTATRDVVMNGISVTKGSYIGLDRKDILSCAGDPVSAAQELICAVNEQSEKEVFIIFCGAQVTQDMIDRLQQHLEEEYPLADIAFVDGKQDVYDFIISLE